MIVSGEQVSVVELEFILRLHEPGRRAIKHGTSVRSKFAL